MAQQFHAYELPTQSIYIMYIVEDKYKNIPKSMINNNLKHVTTPCSSIADG